MSDLSQAAWFKSSRSNPSANCVEVATNLPGLVGIRDSKDPHGPALVVGPDAWAAFANQVKTPNA